jgi:hypothetical protein
MIPFLPGTAGQVLDDTHALGADWLRREAACFRAKGLEVVESRNYRIASECDE